ncbi:MAG TPA: ABC transporter substrate-binding protein [Chloroflexota bacterium]|nr:ABC transporter substrate-binding protein [Chloroflexota bacterium]
MFRAYRLQIILSILGSAVVALLIAVVAYGSGSATVPATGGAYVEGMVGQPEVLNPLLAKPTDYPAQSIDSLIFSGLTREDSTGLPQPDLARSWAITNDGKTYTFYLRPNVTWQDGQPFTADDVLYTLQTIQSPTFSGDADLASAWRGAQITKIDTLTVQVTLPQPFAPILDYASVGILPAHLLSQTSPAALSSSTFNRQPVGTGPYRLLRADLSSVVLEAYPGYYAAKPYISRLMLRFYETDQSVVQAVLDGQVEGDWHVTASDAAKLQRDGRLTFYEAVQPSYSGLAFNMNDSMLSQTPVRQAIAYAIDREKLRAQLLHGAAQLAESPIAPNSWAYDPTTPQYTYDPARAASLLFNAGWQKAGGAWTKNGALLAPELVSDDSPDHVAMARAIAQQLRTFGIGVSLKTVPFNTLLTSYLAPRKFQIALLDWDQGSGDPDPYALWHSSQATPAGLNFSGWKSPMADAALANGRKTTDLAARKRAYAIFQQTFATDLPAFLLFHPVYEYAVDNSIQGVTLPSVIHPWDRFATLSRWYIETRPAKPPSK